MPETAYKAGAFGALKVYKLFIDPYRPQIFASYISGFRAPGLIGFPPPAASPYKPYKTCAQGGAYKFFIDFSPPAAPKPAPCDQRDLGAWYWPGAAVSVTPVPAGTASALSSPRRR